MQIILTEKYLYQRIDEDEVKDEYEKNTGLSLLLKHFRTRIRFMFPVFCVEIMDRLHGVRMR